MALILAEPLLRVSSIGGALHPLIYKIVAKQGLPLAVAFKSIRLAAPNGTCAKVHSGAVVEGVSSFDTLKEPSR